MIRKVLKWIGIVLGGLVGLLVLTIAVLFIVGEVTWNQVYENYDVPVETISIPTDEASIERGEHIATIRLCQQCHGADLSGAALTDLPAVMATISIPNLTAGAGGVGAANSDEDWIRAIRHGVGNDRRALVIMPARAWYYLSDEDLGALIAYLKSVPPVDNELPKRSIGPLGRLLVALGQFPQPQAPRIDHTAPRPVAPEPGVTAAYGQYLARACTACHGDTLSGGIIPIPNTPGIFVPNLTPGGELGGWSEEDFIKTLRTGVTPSGHVLTDNMPWQYAGQMTDDEMKALWMYLESLPALEQNEAPFQ